VSESVELKQLEIDKRVAHYSRIERDLVTRMCRRLRLLPDIYNVEVIFNDGVRKDLIYQDIEKAYIGYLLGTAELLAVKVTMSAEFGLENEKGGSWFILEEWEL
jgi:hypothetical protein